MTAPSPTSHRASRAAVWTALVATYLFWGSTYLGIRLAIDSLPPFLMAGFRFLVAGLILFSFARLRGAPWPTGRQWLAALGVGSLLLTIGNGAVVWAEETLPTGLVALTVSASPIWMVLLDRAFSGARISWPQATGVALGMLGMVILVNPTTTGARLVPLAVLLVGGVAWAAGTLASRTVALPRSTTLANGMEMLAGGAVLLVVAGAAGDLSHVHPERFTAPSLLAVGWLIIFGSLVGFSCYLWLIRVAPIVLVSTQSYVSPVVAVGLGALVLGEHISGRSLVAGAVILAAVVLIASAPLLAAGRGSEELRRGKAA